MEAGVSRRLDPPLTFADAAHAVGWSDPEAKGPRASAGRRLRRLVLRREKEIGHEFAIRDRAGDARWVTLGALTRYLPELRPHRLDSIAAALRPLVEELEARMAKQVAKEVDRQLRTQRNRG
jgi:hypothetical protein